MFYQLNHIDVTFFFTDTATTEIYTLSLHDALPISRSPYFQSLGLCQNHDAREDRVCPQGKTSETILDQKFFPEGKDRKSTRLNSSHVAISYAVFCLKKKKKNKKINIYNYKIKNKIK